jgi:glutathione S-transferase
VILVGQYDSPLVRRVAISLHLLGIRFERNTMSVFADAEAMRRINPLGRIPSLVLDDGEVLIDSAAILDHLDEQVGPERALVPPRGPERRRALRRIALATGCLDKAGAIVYERSLRPADKVFPPWIERCRAQLDGGLAALEADAEAPDAPVTQPAITLGCLLGYLVDRLPEALPDGAYPALRARLAALDTLDAFARTRPSADEQMPGGL